MPAGQVSGVKIPDGVTAQFYTGGFFDGVNTVLAGPYTGAMPDGWDNKAKSLKVFKSASFVVKGSWVNRYSMNEMLSFQLSVGTSISNTKESEKTVENSFSLSITQGFSFMGQDGEV